MLTVYDSNRLHFPFPATFPSPLVMSGLPEPGELRSLHPHVGKSYPKLVQPMGVWPHRQQELTNPWPADAFSPTS